ncbi:MAG TPA: hypothetical protein VHL56_09700 [Candidatus Limnocylindrales bacterium]|nr:hypothetical protein [Candidatus Limnocylindrales bacterium]
MGDFVSAIGQNVSGMVGGAVHALSVAFNSVIAAWQAALPGPWFPISIVVVVVVLAVLFRRLF